MKKKIYILFLAIALILSLFLLTGCSNKEEISIDNTASIKTDEGLLSVEITIPSTLAGETAEQTQEELNELAKEKGYKSVTLNDDGSVTYKMSKSQHKKMMKEMHDTFSDGIKEMIGSENYPNFTDIKFNDNFTDFTIKTTSTSLNLTESFSVMAFYMYGGMYNIYSGEEVDNIHVKFINDATGEIISESNSRDMSEN